MFVFLHESNRELNFEPKHRTFLRFYVSVDIWDFVLVLEDRIIKKNRWNKSHIWSQKFFYNKKRQNLQFASRPSTLVNQISYVTFLIYVIVEQVSGCSVDFVTRNKILLNFLSTIFYLVSLSLYLTTVKSYKLHETYGSAVSI